MKKKTTLKLIIRSLALGGACLILWSWYQGRGPDQQPAAPQKELAVIEKPKSDFPDFERKAPVVVPKVRHVVVQPAGAVKVPKLAKGAPDAVQDFRNWAETYFAAEPAARAGLLKKGSELAVLHRAALKNLMPSDPKTALELAVPMVVRQDLPDEIERLLERRVNERGDLMVLASVPAENGSKEKSVRRIFQPEGAAPGEIVKAYVYGDRERMRSLTGTSANGIRIGGEMVLNDAPFRQLEVGERPDPAKLIVEACPISGITTPMPKTPEAAPAPVQRKVTTVEDYKKTYVLCSSGHIGLFASQLNEQESADHQKNELRLAEGGTGGGSTPFDVPPGWTTGTKRLLYLRVAFPDAQKDVQTEVSVYNNLRQATDFFMSNSFGRYYLTPTVAPLVVLPYPRSWYSAARDDDGVPIGSYILREHAFEVARRMGYDADFYDLDVVEYDPSGPGSFGGLGAVGGRGVWLKTSAVGVLIHELGHNLGLWHANYWVTNPPNRIGPGANDEYGNKFDVMGASNALGDFVAVHKTILGWLTPDTVHQVNASGTYRIHQVDQGRSDADKRYALATGMDSERNYWFEFRQKFPTIASLNNGLMVTWNAWGSGASPDDNEVFSSNSGTHLVDMTPGSGDFADTRDDAGLMIGQTFSDEVVGVHVTPILKSKIVPNQKEIPYVDVVVNRGFYLGNRAPSLNVSADSLSIPLDGEVLLSASATDPDRDTVAYSWNFGDKTYSTDNNRVQKKKWAKFGKYQVLCTASDMKGGRTTRALLITVGAETEPLFDYTVSGRVLDNSLPTPKPVEGVYITNRVLTVGSSQSGATSFRSTYTDSDGFYRLTNLPPNAGSSQTTIIVNKWPQTFSIDGSNQFTLSKDRDGVNWTMEGKVANVEVTVTKGTASEDNPADYGTITLHRSSSAGILNVQMLVSSQGTAQRGPALDYVLRNEATIGASPTVYLPIQVTNANNRAELRGALGVSFANGVDTVSIRVTGLPDNLAEGTEYAVVDFPDTAYAYPGTTNPRTVPYHVTGARSAVIAITDGDSTLPVVTISADDANMIEGTPTTRDSARIRLRRDGPVDNPLTVVLAYNGSADRVDDYNAEVPDPLNIVIPPGKSEFTVNLVPEDDLVAEGLEIGAVSIAPSASYLPDARHNSVDLYIADNDQPLVQVVATVSTTGEGSAGPGRFQISRAAVDISDDLVVNFSLGGSALSGSDYKRVSGIAVIPANELTADIMIESIQDTIQEGPQTVILKLAANSDYAIGDSSTATVTIADNDGSQFSIQGTLLTVSEPAGTSGPVPPVSTTTVRPFRVFRPAAPVVLPPVTTPPTPPPVRQLPITVKYQVVAAKSTARASVFGSTTALNDYVALYDPAKTGELIFEDTDLFKDISVVLNSDDDNENAETLTIELVPVLPGAGYTLGFETEATTLILDNDRPMMDVSYADSLGTSLQNFSETSTGLRFYFSRTGGTTAARTVNFTFGGSALQGTDFTASHSSEITIPAGRTGEYLNITLLNDNIPEGTESLTVNVGAPTVSDAYGVRFGSSTIFIDDDDLYTGVPPPEVSFETTTSTVAEGAEAAIKVNLNAPQPGQVRVSYRLAGGSATGGTRIAGDAGVDYTFTSPNPISGALVFAAGETVKTFQVPTRDDSVPEADETILFELFNPFGANLVGSRFHTVTLNDNSYPEVLTDEVGNRPNLTAELRGRIIPHNLPTTAWFEWGTSPASFPNRVDIPGQLTGTAFVPISTTITGLKFPGTYYYRAVADNTKGTARGIVRTIRTLAAPTVTTTVDAGHTSTSITAAGTINPNRGIVDFYFEYGLTDTLPFGYRTKTQSLANGTKTVVVTALITEFENGPAFTEGTGIYYRLVAGNRSGVGGLVAGGTQYATAIPYKATGDLIVNIQASQPSAGTASWQNLGKPGGAFAVTGAASLVNNVHGTGVPGVFFDGKTAAYELSIPAPVLPATTPPAPWPDVVGADSRTIEVWALNPGYGSPDTLLNMGRDGLTETQLAISHSNLAQTETALSHGTKNASYTATKLPLLGRWNHFVYVYNGPTKTANLYVNGVLNTTVPALTLATTADPITVGAARDATGVLGKHLQGYINSVRIHGGILSVPDIVTNFNLGPAGRTPAPTVLTTGVSDLTTNTVTLNGLVAPGTATSSAWIEWGTSTTYDNASAPISVAVSPVPTPVTLPLANLVPGVEYHYRAVASNAQGVTVGNDVAFTPRVLASRGRLWVDLSAREFTDGMPWKNTAALGEFALLGTPTVTTNVLNTGFPGVEFDGSTDALESSALANFDFSYGDDQTLEAWVLNPTLDNATETIVNQGRVTTPASRLRLSYGTTGGADDSTVTNPWTVAPAAGQWTHLAVVVSAGTRSLYVNGAQVGLPTTHPAGVNQWDDKVLLGATRDTAGLPVFGADAFSGFINSVKIHGGAMLPAQVKASFDAGPVPGASGIAPVVVTSAPSMISDVHATLAGTVQAGGLPSTYWFEWGTTAALGNETPRLSLPNTHLLNAVSGPIGGLPTTTTIHYRLVAQNALSAPGGTLGATQTFMTGAAAPGMPKAQTNVATLISLGKATLNGLATPSTTAATAWFEYGPTSSMTLKSPNVAIAANALPRAMTFSAPTLPHTPYSFRLVVQNANGLVVGSTLTFNSFNSTPVVSPVTMKVVENVATPIPLKGIDADKEPITFTLAGAGITGTSPNFVYTSPGNVAGPVVFNYTATDGAAVSNTATVTITITPVNDAPIANVPVAPFTGPEGAPINGTLTGSDEEDPITGFLISKQPESGGVTINPTSGAFIYTPDVGFYGADSFEFSVVAGGRTSAPAVVSLNVTVPAATALATNVFTAKNTDLDGQVLAKGPISLTGGYAKVTDPNTLLHGAITLFNVDDGTFTFSPVPDYVGVATFTFTVTDGTTPSLPATVTIVVGGPEADSLEFSGVEDDQVAGTLTATNPIAGALNYSLVTTADAKNGAVIVNQDGTFTYNPKAGFVGVDRFDFQATQAVGGLVSNPGTVTITITKRPPNWVWTQGPNVAKTSGVYGTQGVAASTSLLGARADAASWAEPDGTLWVFGGLGMPEGKVAGLLNDLWKRDRTTGEWTWISGSKTVNAKGNYGAQDQAEPTNQPGARSGAASWLGQDGRLWLFGGNGFDAASAKAGNLNDLWVFDPVASEWTWVKGSLNANVNGTYGVKGASASTNTPGARQGATTWVDAENVFWLFGGIGQPGTGILSGSLADLWKFNPSTNLWTWVSGPSTLNVNGVYGQLEEVSGTTAPGSRSYASGWQDKDGVLYLFGGNGLGATGKTIGFLNDVWAYYPESNRWAWIKGNIIVGPASVSGLLGVSNPLNNPSGRAGAGALITDNQEVWVFGGQARTGHLNDLWNFDLQTKNWTLRKGATATALYGTLGVGLPSNTPGARKGYQYYKAQSDLFIFGGGNGANNFNDLWKLDLLDSVQITTLAATAVADTTAILNATFKSTEMNYEAGFRYWPIGNLTEEQYVGADPFGPDAGSVAFDEPITGLSVGTTYAFQAVATIDGVPSYGQTKLFTTTGVPAGVEVNFRRVLASTSDDTPEGGGDYFVEVYLSAPAPSLVTVPLVVSVPGPLDFSGFAVLNEDYRAVVPVVSFPSGQTSALVRIPLMNDVINEPAEVLTVTAGTPTGPATLGLDTAFVLTINDDDSAPFVATPPVSTFAIVGEVVSLDLVATGDRLKYQWRRNGVNIPKATLSTYQFTATLASAGIYTCMVTNDVDFTETRADVFVLETAPRRLVVPAGDIQKSLVSFSVKAAAPVGATLVYRWRDAAAAVDTPIVGDDTAYPISGNESDTIKLAGPRPPHSGGYICRVSRAGDPSFFRDSAVHVLSVPDAAPELILPPTLLPDGVINTFYSYQVQVNPDLRKQPFRYGATGLPRGLTINATTGLISGKPTASTPSGQPAKVVITASSSSVNSHTLDRDLTIQSLPLGIQGTYVALLERAPATNQMGGRVDLSITPAGVYTMKLLMNGLTSSSSGTMTAVITPPSTFTGVTGSAVIKRKVGQSNLTLQFNVTAAGVLSVVLTDPDATPSTVANSTESVRQTYASPATLLASNAPNFGDYTMLLEIADAQSGDLQIPQGNGYVTMKLAADGKVTGAGRTADGNAFTLATILGPTANTKIPIFASFTPVIGTLVGAATADASGYLTGTMTWNKGPAPATAKTSFYPTGFAPISLRLIGGRYTLDPGTVASGLGSSPNNAKLSFSEGGLLQTELDTLVFSITRPAAAHVITIPAPNTNKLTFALPATPAGSFNGKVTIPNPVTALTRNLTFQGVIVKTGAATWQSAGYVLIPQLPQPGQTLTTSPVYSGQVVLERNP